MKKVLCAGLAALMFLTNFGFAGGAKAKDGNESAAVRTVIDHNGDEVVLPAKIERVVIASLMPLPAVYCLFRGGTHNLVGIPTASMAEKWLIASYASTAAAVATPHTAMVLLSHHPLTWRATKAV